MKGFLCILLVGWLWLPYAAMAQNPTITAAEYFFDADPGVGGGISFPVPFTANLNMQTQITLNGLPLGFHTLSVRIKDDKDFWSLARTRVFLIESPSNTGPSNNISAIEYFFDSDPGNGNGTGVTVSSGTEASVAIPISLSGLSEGFHQIGVRFQDQIGNWSLTKSRVFLVQSPGTTGQSNTLTAAEYFFNSDPGTGNGTKVNVIQGTEASVAIPINLSGLSEGFQQIGIRFQDQNGNWSLTKTRVFLVQNTGSNPPLLPLTATEYFIDTDPGTGLGKSLSLSSGPNPQVLGNISLASIQPGFHTISVRFKSQDNNWGIAKSRLFYVGDENLNKPVMVDYVEYFFDDTDPGEGKAISITLSEPITPLYVEQLIAVAALPKGSHTISVRIRDNKGLWSRVVIEDFIVGDPKFTTPPIPDLEELSDIESSCLINLTDLTAPTAKAEDGSPVTGTVNEELFPITKQGSTEITWTYTDNNGLKSAQKQLIVLEDKEVPTLIVPSKLVLNLGENQCSISEPELGEVTATDNCSDPTVTNNAPEAFSVGTTIVTWTVTDAAGNQVQDTQEVEVIDAILPTIIAPSDVNIRIAAGEEIVEVVDIGHPVSSDNCGLNEVVNDAPTSFPVGQTRIIWTVRDVNGNSATAQQTITVTKDLLPIITAPAVITAHTDQGICTASNLDLGIPNVSGDEIPEDGISNDAPAIFPLGTTVVTWTVTDVKGNTATATQSVLITDAELPKIISPADVSISSTQFSCNAENIDLGEPEISDNCGVASVVNNAPSTFPLGTTTVIWTVTDVDGNVETAEQKVTVIDEQDPLITAPNDLTVLISLGEVNAGSVALGQPAVSDNCSVASIRNNAPSLFPLGTTIVTWTVTDGSGNTTTAQQRVTVIGETVSTIIGLNAPSQIFEGGKATVSVSRNGGTSGAQIVNISYNPSNRLSGPAAVTILAGQSSRSFEITVTDNDLVEGPTTVTLSASAENFSPVSSNITINDNDQPSLSIQNLSPKANEGDVVTFKVTTNLPPAAPLQVFLSSNSSRFPVPPNVTIPAGQLSVDVTVKVISNDLPELDVEAVVTLSASGHNFTTGAILVVDDDMPGLELIILSDTVGESSGFFATKGILKRSPGSNPIAFEANLTASLTNTLILPKSISLATNEMEKVFDIGLVDNSEVEGFREVVIDAALLVSGCGCNAPNTSAGFVEASLVVADNDGASLTLTATPLTLREGLSNAGTLRISRNTLTSEALIVSLSTDNTDEATLPSIATIPAGAAFIEVPIATINDGESDGNQQVFLKASAQGFSPGIVWVMVTDQNKPDLLIASASVGSTGIPALGLFDYTVEVTNTGFASAISGAEVLGYLSQDTVLDDSDVQVTQDFIPNPIAVGQKLQLVNAAQMPNLPGDWKLIFSVNPTNSISELLFTNNNSQSIDLAVTPDYTATANVANNYYFRGNTIPITGTVTRANGLPAANEQVEVYVITVPQGLRREILATTDANGNYTANFIPLTNESGSFSVGASFPGVGTKVAQDNFDILGVKVNNASIARLLVTIGDTLSGSLEVENLSSTDLSDFTLSPFKLPNGAIIAFDTIPVLTGNSSEFLGYRVSGNLVTPGVNFEVAELRATSSIGEIQPIFTFYYCQAAGGLISANISSITTSASAIAGHKLVEFKLVNSGSGSTGDIELSLPKVGWISSVTPEIISELFPGDSATVILKFLASDELPFDFALTGNIAINAKNGNSISMPFNFTKVAQADGSLVVDVVNQFTYFSDEEPKVEAAFVKVSNYFSGVVYAEGLTNAEGIFAATGIPEGTHRISVQKEKHLPFSGTISINPGAQNKKTIFINYQAVTFSWQVVPTGIEDEYTVNLISEFETNIPMPVVTVDMPDVMPQLLGDEIYAFNATLINHGLITAKDVSFNLPKDDPEYEFIHNYVTADLLALQSIQIPVIMRRRLEPLNEEVNPNGPSLRQISEFLGMEESQFKMMANDVSNCQDVVYVVYWYKCSIETGLWTQWGKTILYEGRTCSRSGRGGGIRDPFRPTPGQGGGVGGGIGPCIGCPSIPTGGGGIPPASTIEKSSCVECILDIVSAMADCIPVTKAGKAAGEKVQEAVELIKVGYCFYQATNIEEGLSCIPTPEPELPSIPCVSAVLDAIETCSGTSVDGDVVAPAAFKIASFQALENISLNKNGPELGAVFSQIAKDLRTAKGAFEARENWAGEYFGDMTFADSFYDLVPKIEKYVVNFDTISLEDQQRIINEMVGYDISSAQLEAFFTRWNISMVAWDAGTFEPSEAYPNIINRNVVESFVDEINQAIQYSNDRGFESVVEMYIAAWEYLDEVTSAANSSVCASVTMKISQEVTMTREAFDGTLTIFNGHPTDQLDSLTVNVEIRNPDGVVSNGLFQIETLQLTNLSDVTGTGAIDAQNEGSVVFRFIPTGSAAPEFPVEYGFGGSITYFDPYAQAMVTLPLSPVTLTVNPSPNLYLHYFMERNILSDDALTQDVVEPTIPAELAVMVQNSGYGPAVNMTISSAQPEILDNEKGLAIDFNLIGSNFQGQPAKFGVTNINFGTIPALESRIGQWYFTSSLLGKFVNYTANVVHNNSFGNPELSLIEGVTLHELTRSIVVYGEQEDGINDFLVNDVFDARDEPDVIYLSQGFETLPVLPAETGSFNGPVQGPSFTNILTVTPQEEGWNFIKLDDPGNGRFDIVSVTRSDGQVLPLANTWLTFVTLPASRQPVYENKFHFVDNIPSAVPTTYTVVWTPKNFDVPELMSIIGLPEGVSGEQVTNFTVRFSKPIDPASFDFRDLTLVYQGNPVVLDENVVVTQLTPESFEVNIAPFTLGNGFYLITVQAAGVTDIFGISGKAGKQATWTQYIDIPAVMAFQGLPENNLGSNFNRVDVLFNLPVDPATVTPDRFTVLRDADLQAGSLVIDSVRADQRMYYLSGLKDILTTDGIYELVVDMSAIETPSGIPGAQEQSVRLTLDSQGPSVLSIKANNEGGLDSQHLNYVDIQFNEPVFGFTIGDVVLQRNGEQIFLNIAQLQNISQDFWKGGNFQMLTYFEGDYTFTINLGGITDALGNPGKGTAEISWTVDRSVTMEISNLGISPDLGISDDDGISSQLSFDAKFDLNQDASQVTISQVDFGAESTLVTLNNVKAGSLSIPLVFPTGGNTAIKVTATGEIGGFTTAQKTLFIDQSPLNADWVFTNGQQLDRQFAEIGIAFSAPLLNDAPLADALQLRRNGQLIAGTLEFTQSDELGYIINGIEGLSYSPGNYEISIDLSLLQKQSSGISGSSVKKASWTVLSNNATPLANAGDDRTITLSGSYSLDGSASNDPNGDPITYKWVAPAGIVLSDEASPSPTFTVSGANNGTYNILLIVSDGELFSTDRMNLVIEVIGDESLSIIAPANITLDTDEGSCEATEIELGTPTVTGEDIPLDGISNDAPESFTTGTTIVTWTVVDGNGNTATAQQTVTVKDNEVPVIAAVSDIIRSADDGTCDAEIDNEAPAVSDNCDSPTATGTRSDGLALDEPYPVGTTEITWTASDASGNNAEAVVQKLTVEDNEAPSISAPGNLTVQVDPGSSVSTNLNLGKPTVSDNCEVANISNDAPDSFPVGNTAVTWTVIDASGNSATAAQTVTVLEEESELPTIIPPANVSVNADQRACEATGVDIGTASFTGDIPDTGLTNDAPESFPLGITIVTWIVKDDKGNSASATQTITVTDDQKPILSAPANVIIGTDEGDCSASSVDLGQPVVSDNCSIVSVTKNAPSTFPLGETKVVWTVVDGSGNSETAVQFITVKDLEAPTIQAPADITINTDPESCHALIVDLGNPTVSDNCSVESIENDSPEYFQIGETIVLWTVTDGNGNTATASQKVVVFDNESPTISVSGNVIVRADPGKMFASDVDLGEITTYDNCDFVDVLNDAPSIFPIGITTVRWTVKDGSGNSGSTIQQVTVLPNDTELPTVTAPTDITVDTDKGICEAGEVFLGIATFTGDIPEGGLTNDAPSAFPLGETIVTWTVTDRNGNSATSIQKVVVRDRELPEIKAPTNLVLSSSGGGIPAKEVDLGEPETSDNCSIAEIRNNAPAIFPIGTTTVTWTILDGSGNICTAKQKVTVSLVNVECKVIAKAIPELTVKLDKDGKGKITPEMADNGSTSDCGPVKLELSKCDFTCADLGEQIVKLYAIDKNGKKVNTKLKVIVVDEIMPKITVDQTPFVWIMRSGDTFVMPDFKDRTTASDNCSFEVTQTPTPGIVFKKPENCYIEFEAKDQSGNIAMAKFRFKLIVFKCRVVGKKSRETDEVTNDLVTVPWNTPFERLVAEGIEFEEGSDMEAIRQIKWTSDGYDPLRPGFYQLKATVKNEGFEGMDVSFQIPVLVLNKPMPEDIILSNNVVSKKVRSGEIIGGLQTIDPVDNIHSYSMIDHPNYYIEKGVLVWKGEGMPPLETTLRVSSTDRAGQTIHREIKVMREMDNPNDALIYPNPASSNTNIYIRMAQGSNVTIRIFDAAGRQIYDESGYQESSFTRSLDIRGYAAGMYQVVIQIDQHFITKRLVKE